MSHDDKRQVENPTEDAGTAGVSVGDDPAPPPEVAEDAAGEHENPPVARDEQGTPEEQPWGAP